MAQDQWTLQREKQLAGSQAARKQSLAPNTQVWGTWRLLTCSPRPPPFYMAAANNGAWAAQMAQWMGGGCNTVRGPPLQTRGVAVNGTVLAACKLLLAMIPAHMEMNRWGAKQNERGLVNRGSGHGMAKVAGKQSPQNKAVAGQHSRRTIRPAQAL